jgi:hypothetical protein
MCRFEGGSVNVPNSEKSLECQERRMYSREAKGVYEVVRRREGKGRKGVEGIAAPKQRPKREGGTGRTRTPTGDNEGTM